MKNGFLVNTHSIYDVDMSNGVLVTNEEQLDEVLTENNKNIALYRETGQKKYKERAAYACFTAAGFSEGWTEKKNGTRRLCKMYRSEGTTTGLTPLITLDIDHVDGMVEWERVKTILLEKYGELEQSPLAWAFLSPSKALKLVFWMGEYQSIREVQQGLYDELQVREENRDLSTSNFSRATFLCGPDDTLFINGEKLFGEYEPMVILRENKDDEPQIFEPEPLDDVDLLKKMQEEWIREYGYDDGNVPKGHRHEVSVKMYCDFAPLFGFKPELMVDNLRIIEENREVALPIAEWACKTKKADPLGRISKLMRRLKARHNLQLSGSEICAEPELPAHLPHNMELLLKETPRQYWKQACVALLPMLGTLASGARSTYFDGRHHSPTFLVGIIGEQSSNKSFIADLDKVVMESLREMDDIERKQKQENKEQRASVDKGQQKPRAYKGVIREISASRSLGELQSMMENAEGLHLYCFSSEMDTMNRSQKGGPWADMSDFLRYAFDNERFGSDYKNDDSSALRPRAFYNQLTLGTPDSYVEFFKGNITNGLGTRFLLPKMPIEFAQDFPQHEHWTEEEQEEVKQVIQDMMKEGNGIEHHYELPRCLEVAHDFCHEVCQKMTMAGQNSETTCINEDYKRCAVMAYRAGLVAYLLNNKVEDETVTDFVDFVAHYALSCHWDFLGDAEVHAKEHPKTFITQMVGTKWKRMLSHLPSEFTLDDVMLECWVSDISTDNLRAQLRRMMKNGTIVETGKERWVRAAA